MILYDEYNWGDATKCVGFFVGLAVTFFGVYLVGKKDVPSKQSGREKLLGDSNSIEVSIAEYTDESSQQALDDGMRPRRCVCFPLWLSSRLLVSSILVPLGHLSSRQGQMRALDQ
jgi:hypothetical protein